MQEAIDIYITFIAAASTYWDFLHVLDMNGCSTGCVTATHHLLSTDVLQYHEHFTALSQMARKQWLLDYLVMNSSVKNEQVEVAYLVCGKTVCSKVWIAILGISLSHFYNVKSLFLNGRKRIIQQIHRVPLQRTSEATAWMDSFFTCMGDRMPDRPTVHPPSSLSNVSIYSQMPSPMRKGCLHQSVSVF